jgi:uncharacterized protein (DUF1697 family)
MGTYTALLGGINVGGHRVRMTDLRTHFEALGLSSVSTFIASGNVSFETTARNVTRLEARIERHLEQALGYAVPTFIRTPQELAAIAAYEPFPPGVLASGFHTIHVLVMADVLPPDAQRTLLTFRTPLDELHVRDREIYWLCRKKMTESVLDWRQVGRAVSLPRLTMRNVNTVRRLAARHTATARPP